MKVFVTGGSGFIGAEIIRRLSAAGHTARVLVRQSPRAHQARFPEGVLRAPGNILDPDLERHLAGVDAVIHLVGIIREQPHLGVTFQKMHVEATDNVIRAMQAAGVRRLVHMSALGAGPDAPTQYFATKWAAETAVRESGLCWTVMKPSVVFGPGDEFINMLARQVRRLPLVPVIGDGNYLLQPVAVETVAEGFVRALTTAAAEGQVYEIGGPEQLGYNELLNAVGRALGKTSVSKFHLPLGPMRRLIALMEKFSFFPLTSDQLSMLLMNNICDPGRFLRDFGLLSMPLETGIKTYLR